jgi:hypothetical protein
MAAVLLVSNATWLDTAENTMSDTTLLQCERQGRLETNRGNIQTPSAEFPLLDPQDVHDQHLALYPDQSCTSLERGCDQSLVH